MHSVAKTFNNFLFKFGIINQEGVKHMTNTDDIHEENFEHILIENLKRLIKIASIVESMYEKFVLNDDQLIIRVVRRLIIIYAQKLRTEKQRSFYKWLGKLTTKKETRVQKKKDSPIRKEVYKKKIIPVKEEEKSGYDPTLSLLLSSPMSNRVSSPSSLIEISKAENFEIKKPTVKTHDRLYKDKYKRQEMLSEIISKYQNAETKECTFTPKITRTKSMRSIKSQREFSKNQHDEYINRENRLRQLSVEREKYLSTVYTFEPNISNKGKIGVEGDFFVRMKNYQSSKQRRIKRINDEIISKIPKPHTRSKNNSFVLGSKEESINLESKRGSHLLASTFEGNLTQLKQEKLKKIEKEIMKEKGITFKPKLNDKINKNIGSSLIERNDDFIKNKNIKLSQYVTRDDIECTFAPKINETQIKSDVKVGDRLFQYQKKYNQKLEEKKGLYKEEYTFKPEISGNTDEILKQRELTLNLVKQKYYSSPKDSKRTNELQRYNDNNGTPYSDEAQINFELAEDKQTSPNDVMLSKKTFTLNNSVREVKDQINQMSIGISKEQSVYVDGLRKSSVLHSVKTSSQIPLQCVSDSQLMEKANNFITTDESLQKFQKGMKDKYKNVSADRNNYMTVIDHTMKEKFKTNKNFKEVIESTPKGEDSSIMGHQSSKRASSKSKTKSITKNMAYYDNIDC